MLATETGDLVLSPISETEFDYLDGGDEMTFVKGDDDSFKQTQCRVAILSRIKERKMATN